MTETSTEESVPFSPKISSAVKAKLAELQEKQKEFQKKKNLIWIIFGSLILGTLVTCYYSGTNPLVILVLLALVAFLIISYLKTKILKSFKAEILTTQMAAVKEIKYQSEGVVPAAEFRASKVYQQRIDRYSGEDLFAGKKDKTSYRFSEVIAQQKRTTTDSKGRTKTTWVTVFDGILMVADFNKHLKSETMVVQQAESIFSKWFTNKNKVTLESPEFEKIFETYSQDQVEARYVLTPAMMERIMELQKHMNARIHLNFSGSKVYIAISNSYNFFEADVNQEINSEQLERIFDEINDCIAIIDILDLNTRIWTKE